MCRTVHPAFPLDLSSIAAVPGRNLKLEQAGQPEDSVYAMDTIKTSWKGESPDAVHLELVCDECRRLSSSGDLCSGCSTASETESCYTEEDAHLIAHLLHSAYHVEGYRGKLSKRLGCWLSAPAFAGSFAVIVALALFLAYPFPCTVPIFIAAVFGLVFWTTAESLMLAAFFLLPPSIHTSKRKAWSTLKRCTYIAAVVATLLVTSFGLQPPVLAVPTIHRSNADIPERYIIAAALHNNQAVYPTWSAEVVKLAYHCERSPQRIIW